MPESMWVDLEVLTPTHVGNGSDISPLEYWIDDGFARVHMDALFADPEFSPYLEPFIRDAASQRYLGQHLPGQLLSRHVRYQVPMAPDARQYLVQHQVQVKEFIKSAGRAFIPGSSIKGSLLTALINHLLVLASQSAEKRNYVESLIGDPHNFSRLLDFTIGDLRVSGEGQKDRFYRWLDVSDSSLSLPDKSLCVYYSVVVGARKGHLPILFEGVVPGTRWVVSLKATPNSRFKLEEMLKIADAFYRAVWKKCGVSDAPPEKGFLLRLGQGSSAWATSLLLLAESSGLKYRIQPPRTSKLVDAVTPMGWVVLSPSERSSLAFETEGTQGVEHSAIDTYRYRAKVEKAVSVAPIAGKTPLQSPPLQPKRRPSTIPTEEKPGSNLSMKALCALAEKWLPSDKIGLERIISSLDGLEEKQASQLAAVLRERLRSLGQWDKYPRRFDIECFILGE